MNLREMQYLSNMNVSCQRRIPLKPLDLAVCYLIRGFRLHIDQTFLCCWRTVYINLHGHWIWFTNCSENCFQLSRTQGLVSCLAWYQKLSLPPINVSEIYHVSLFTVSLNYRMFKGTTLAMPMPSQTWILPLQLLRRHHQRSGQFIWFWP